MNRVRRSAPTEPYACVAQRAVRARNAASPSRGVVARRGSAARRVFAAVLLSLLGLAGCSAIESDGPNPMLPTTRMTIGSREFTVEEAVTNAEQERGLMRRDAMAADHGMVFIFPEEGPRQFWNHNVRFPLDVVFIDADGNVTSVQRMEAYNDTPTKTVRAKYVVELNAGTAADVGVKKGDRLTVPPDVAKPRK